MVKILPKVCEIWVQYLGQEDPLEKEMATYCSVLAWKIWQAIWAFQSVMYVQLNILSGLTGGSKVKIEASVLIPRLEPIVLGV